MKISFLLEHKSYRDDFVKLQLGEYLFGAYSRQRMEKRPLQVVIPILVYHDKRKWKVQKLAELFELPHPDLAQFIPNFNVLFLDIQRMTDDVIIQTQEAVFLKSTLLLFKYKGENEQLLRIIEEVFIFVERALNETEKQRFIKLYLHYLFSAFKLTQVETEKVIKKIPPMIVQEFENTYDLARKEGMIIGEKKGKIEGKIKGETILKFTNMILFLKDFPEWRSEQIATYSKIELPKVVKFQKTLAKHLPQDKLQKEIKKQFFKNIELSSKEENELIELVKNYLKIQKN